MTLDAKLKAAIVAAGQEQVLRYWDELDADGQKRLSSQLQNIDFAELTRLIKAYVLKRPETVIPDDLAPAPYFPLVPRDAEQAELYVRAKKLGIELLRAGRVCFLTVAGGQGTRLGFNAPKGTFPIGPVTGKSRH